MTRRRRLASLALSTILAIGAGSLALAAPPAPPAGASPQPGGHAPGAPARPGGQPAAQTPAQSNAGGSIATPDYRIETDSTNWNFNTGDFTMPHRVHFLRPGTDAIGDRASGNSKRGTATLYGDVVVHDSGNANEAGDAAYRGNGPATLTCDQLDLDTRAKLYIATGHVHFAQGTRAGTADKATLNRASGQLHLEGDVHLSDNGSTLAGESVDYDLNNKNAEIHGKPAVMTQPVNQQQQQPPPTAAPKHPSAPKNNPHKPASPAPTHKP